MDGFGHRLRCQWVLAPDATFRLCDVCVHAFPFLLPLHTTHVVSIEPAVAQRRPPLVSRTTLAPQTARATVCGKARGSTARRASTRRDQARLARAPGSSSVRGHGKGGYLVCECICNVGGIEAFIFLFTGTDSDHLWGSFISDRVW